MDAEHQELILDTKQLLLDQYHFESKHIKEEYEIVLNDGSTVSPDLVLLTGIITAKPYAVIFVTKNEVPKELIRSILINSEILYGMCRRIDDTGFGHFWGIGKAKSIFGKVKIVSIPDYKVKFYSIDSDGGARSF